MSDPSQTSDQIRPTPWADEQARAREAQKPKSDPVRVGEPREWVGARLGGHPHARDKPDDDEIRHIALAFALEHMEINSGSNTAVEFGENYIAAAKLFEAYLRGDDKTEA